MKTGTVLFAGTDAAVYITLYGTNGNSGERLLPSSIDDFENGTEDSFSVEVRDLGDVARLRIRHDNTGVASGWFLEKIIVRNESNGREWTFPCNRWLARDEDDGAIDRTLGSA